MVGGTVGRRANQPDTHFVFLAYILMQSGGLTDRARERASERESDRDRDHRTKLRGIYEGGTIL